MRRDREECRDFLQRAFELYSSSKHQVLLDSAIYVLMDNDQTLETSIARLFSGIQGALVFANQQHQFTGKRPLIGTLFRTFTAPHPGVFDDLWPPIDPRQGPPYSHFRNAIVHGEAFSEGWLALSYAGVHRRWSQERIILIALGWDIEKSSVSISALRLFNGHWKWKEERDKLTLTLKNP